MISDRSRVSAWLKLTRKPADDPLSRLDSVGAWRADPIRAEGPSDGSRTGATNGRRCGRGRAGVAFAAVWMWRRRRAGRHGGDRTATVASIELDPATGLMTRGRFELALQDGLLVAEKRGTDSCVLHVALDGLRLAVDDGGPALAAKMLAAIAARLRESCGKSTPLARMGTTSSRSGWMPRKKQARSSQRASPRPSPHPSASTDAISSWSCRWAWLWHPSTMPGCA